MAAAKTAQQKRTAMEKLLASFPPFAALDDRSRARIAKGAAEIDAPRGTLLFSPGELCQGIHIIISGRVKLALKRDNSEKVISLMGPGCCFGETAMFLDEPHMVSAEALSPVKIVLVSKSSLLACLRRNPHFALQMIAALSRRLRDLMCEIESATRHSGTQRVVDFLIAELADAGERGAATIALPAKKRIIASRLDLTHEHFSRILGDLMAARLIVVEGPRVTVPDVRELRAYRPAPHASRHEQPSA